MFCKLYILVLRKHYFSLTFFPPGEVRNDLSVSAFTKDWLQQRLAQSSPACSDLSLHVGLIGTSLSGKTCINWLRHYFPDRCTHLHRGCLDDTVKPNRWSLDQLRTLSLCFSSILHSNFKARLVARRAKSNDVMSFWTVAKNIWYRGVYKQCEHH